MDLRIVGSQARLNFSDCTRISSKTEVWQPLVEYGFPNYAVSSCGRVVNIRLGRLLQGYLLPQGYIRVQLPHKGDTKSICVHTLVALAFLGPALGRTVDHINRDRTDNRVENLRWATPSEQAFNTTRSARNSSQEIYQFDQEGNFVASWQGLADAADAVGLTKQSISRACNCCTLARGYYWQYMVEELEDEEWAPVPDAKDTYVSTLGRVILPSLKLTFGSPTDDGYRTVSVTLDGQKRKCRVHRLIALTFLGPNNLLVNHKNGIKHDNRLANLEYVTPKQNTLHAMKIGTWQFRGSHQRVGQYNLEGKLIQIYENVTIASQNLDINYSSIAKVARGYRQTAGGYKWKYLDVIKWD